MLGTKRLAMYAKHTTCMQYSQLVAERQIATPSGSTSWAFSPRPSLKLEMLSPEAKRIYGGLVAKHDSLYVGYERLYRRSHGAVKVWPGKRNMPSGVWAWLSTQGVLGATITLAGYDR